LDPECHLYEDLGLIHLTRIKNVLSCPSLFAHNIPYP
jgi:hypothetical protein